MILKRVGEIERFLAAPPGELRACLIHGRDAGLVREYGARLTARIAADPANPFDVAIVDSQSPRAGALLDEELSAVSMFGGRRLVRLPLSAESDGADFVTIVAQHLAGDLNPDAVLIIQAGAMRAPTALARTLERSPHAAVLVCYSDEPAEVAQIVRKALAQDGLSLAADALHAFCARLPQDRGLVRQEIERLILFLGPDRPTPGTSADLEGFLGVEPEISLAAAALAAFGGRPGAALAGLARARRQGEGGVAALRVLAQ
ncbi:MAG: DNA polymerase III subunit delta, partial [Candidatus Dormibacteria bacterium]